MLRALKKPEPKVFVCACTGGEKRMQCKHSKYTSSVAGELVAASNGTAKAGKCENVKFALCKCNKDGKCHTVKVAAPAVPAQVKKNTTSMGACPIVVVTNNSTNTDGNSTDVLTNSTETNETETNTTTRF